VFWFWLGSIGLPYLALLALTIIRGSKGRAAGLTQTFNALGSELCILGLGVSGAVCSSSEIRQGIGPNAVTVGMAILLIDLIITGFCFNASGNTKWSDGTRASLSVFLGLLILAINTAIVLRFTQL
jgi:hypothetical protein